MNCQKNKLIFNLDILTEGRKKLIADFTGKNPEIYTPIFEYENIPYQMKLSREKYFLRWIDYHWLIIDKYFCKKSVEEKDQQFLRSSFSRVFLQFLRLFGFNSTEKKMSKLFYRLLKEEINLLESINQAGDNTNKKLESLRYNYARDKALFEREINRIKGERNDDIKDVR